jgi:hypothetical protein
MKRFFIALALAAAMVPAVTFAGPLKPVPPPAPPAPSAPFKMPTFLFIGHTMGGGLAMMTSYQKHCSGGWKDYITMDAQNHVSSIDCWAVFTNDSQNVHIRMAGSTEDMVYPLSAFDDALK